jgi:hypothetical protein
MLAVMKCEIARSHVLRKLYSIDGAIDTLAETPLCP